MEYLALMTQIQWVFNVDDWYGVSFGDAEAFDFEGGHWADVLLVLLLGVDQAECLKSLDTLCLSDVGLNMYASNGYTWWLRWINLEDFFNLAVHN
jgi:hypothetical protein